VCGDGECNEPFEFPAYGRFGCRPDCGSAKNLATVLIQVKADFRDDFISPVVLQGSASWNLCQRNAESKEAGFPDICWWEDDKTFDTVKPNHVETINVPADTLWYVRILGDYKGRVEGNIYLVEGLETPWVGTVPEWKHCEREVKTTRAAPGVVAAAQNGRRRSRSLLLEQVERQVEEGIKIGDAARVAAEAAAEVQWPAVEMKRRSLGDMEWPAGESASASAAAAASAAKAKAKAKAASWAQLPTPLTPLFTRDTNALSPPPRPTKLDVEKRAAIRRGRAEIAKRAREHLLSIQRQVPLVYGTQLRENAEEKTKPPTTKTKQAPKPPAKRGRRRRGSAPAPDAASPGSDDKSQGGGGIFIPPLRSYASDASSRTLPTAPPVTELRRRKLLLAATGGALNRNNKASGEDYDYERYGLEYQVGVASLHFSNTSASVVSSTYLLRTSFAQFTWEAWIKPDVVPQASSLFQHGLNGSDGWGGAH
jgi:hypothetical protein